MKLLLMVVLMPLAMLAQSEPTGPQGHPGPTPTSFAISKAGMAQAEVLEMKEKVAVDLINKLAELIGAPIQAARQSLAAEICAEWKIPAATCKVDLKTGTVSKVDPPAPVTAPAGDKK